MVRLCSVEGCENKHWAKEFCKSHYKKWRRFGDPLHVVNYVTMICSFEGCEVKHQAYGYCNMHYNKWKRFGDPKHITDPKETGKKKEPIRQLSFYVSTFGYNVSAAT